MVQQGYEDTDDGMSGLDPDNLKYTLRKPVTPYVCSTPCDFDAEREYIAKETFPQLEELCVERGTIFQPCDIHWKPGGLQTESGQLLRVNLDYINKCAPFFLCLLGETYGPYRTAELGDLPKSSLCLSESPHWLDKNFLYAAEAGYSWLWREGHQNCSIPEIEIIQAAFLGRNKYCHFYYRQPEHLDDLLTDATDEEAEALLRLHKPEDEDSDLNIRDLKQRIVNKGFIVKYFRSCQELGELILEDWKQVIDELYPPLLEGPAVYDTEEYQEWLFHEVFSESRRQLLLDHSELRTLKGTLTGFCGNILDEPGIEHLEDELRQRFVSHYCSTINLQKQEVKRKSIMVLRSDRGMGKSTLVASWVKQFSQANPDIKVIGHYIGCSGRSRDVMTLMRRCVTELRQTYTPEDLDGLPNVEIGGETFKQLSSIFQACLALGPCVLVLDGVDKIASSAVHGPLEVKDFSWIPTPLPQQCRIVITTVNSDLSYHYLMKRMDTKFLTLSKLNTTKLKAECLEDFTQVHYGNLKGIHLRNIFETKLSGRPLFLRSMGNELKSRSVYTNLEVYTEMLRDLCKSICDLYVRSFKRWIVDHSWTYEVLSTEQTESVTTDFIGWVPDVLRLLAVSRSGLTANEILDMLFAIGYQENVKVVQFDWLMFLQCIGDNLTESPYGVLNFSHQHMREIVEYMLLGRVNVCTTEPITSTQKEWLKNKSEFHQHVAKYFYTQDSSQRRIVELPWQLLMAGDMQALKNVLSQPDIFERLFDTSGRYPSNNYDLHQYWYYLTKEGYSVVDTYKGLLSKLGVLPEEPIQDEYYYGDRGDGASSVASSLRSEAYLDFHSDSARTADSIPKVVLHCPSSTGLQSAVPKQLSVIEEGSDTFVYKGDNENGDNVFITLRDFPEDEPYSNVQYDLKPAQVTSLTWNIAQFLLELGHNQAGEVILVALHNRLMMEYPLQETDLLIHGKAKARLGQLYLDHGNLDLAEKYYKKALRTVMDMFDLEESSPELMAEIQHLKCEVIKQMGYLRMLEGMLGDADDLLQEALDLSEVTRSVPMRAMILFHISSLRFREEDYLMAETNLRKCLILRKQWYGPSHPLVADVLFSLGKLMSAPENEKGYDQTIAGNALRRCLEIRESHLDKDHLQVAQVLFELAKVLKRETSYSGRKERNTFLARALDIRITKLGAEHIETRSVRAYLNNLEVSLKFPKKDSRSLDRPFSSLSWRSHDLANIEKKSRLQSGKSVSYGQPSRPGSHISKNGSLASRPYSHSTSRPVSGRTDITTGSMKSSSIQYLSASERIMLETSKPRLLHRDSVNRKLKQGTKPSYSPQYSQEMRSTENLSDDHHKHLNIDIDLSIEQDADSSVLVDSYGYENVKLKALSGSVTDVSQHEDPERRETQPQRLYRRFAGAQQQQHNVFNDTGPSSGEVTLRTSNSFVSRKEHTHKKKRPTGSARSGRSNVSSMWTTTSGNSMPSHRSACDIPREPHSLHQSNTRTITSGPHSSVKSLLTGHSLANRQTTGGVQHKSAWYHVPGRYKTDHGKYPPKRSQQREEAKQISKCVTEQSHDPHKAFMQSEYRKSNPRMVNKGYPGKDGHTCMKGQAYPPYSRDDQKQFIVCETCQTQTAQIMAGRQQEMHEHHDETHLLLTPMVNQLATPDRPRQSGYVFEEPITPDDYNGQPTVTFKDAVIIN